MRKPLVLLPNNEKGGVGKTSVTHAIACGLASRKVKHEGVYYPKYRVMVIDGDPQGHATLRFGMKKAGGMYDLLVRDAEWGDVVRGVPAERYNVPGEVPVTDNLFVLPGNIETSNIPNMIRDGTILRSRIEELEVDVVIIDTPPTATMLHTLYYLASDIALYPAELSKCSFDGLRESFKHRTEADGVRGEFGVNSKLRMGGIIPTKYRNNTAEERILFDELKKKYPHQTWSPLCLSTKWKEAESLALPVYSIAPNSAAADEVWELIDRVEMEIANYVKA